MRKHLESAPNSDNNMVKDGFVARSTKCTEWKSALSCINTFPWEAFHALINNKTEHIKLMLNSFNNATMFLGILHCWFTYFSIQGHLISTTSCASNPGTVKSLKQSGEGSSTVYQCVCKANVGQLNEVNLGYEKLTCTAHYWECPL